MHDLLKQLVVVNLHDLDHKDIRIFHYSDDQEVVLHGISCPFDYLLLVCGYDGLKWKSFLYVGKEDLFRLDHCVYGRVRTDFLKVGEDDQGLVWNINFDSMMGNLLNFVNLDFINHFDEAIYSFGFEKESDQFDD